MRVSLALTLLVASLLPATVIPAQTKPQSFARLPIVEIPADTGKTLAIFWSGDGKWAELDQTVSTHLAAAGVAVVGIDSRTWLTTRARSADDAAQVTEELLDYYLAHWSRSRIVLIGYSRGAGFVPLIVNRLRPELRSRVSLAAMLGAENTASFEFHFLDLVRATNRPSDIPVLPEIDKVLAGGTRMLCLYGNTEEDTVCPRLDPKRVTVVKRSGDHHFDRNYPAIAQNVLEAIDVGFRSKQ